LISNLLFLIMALLLISLAPEGNGNYWIASPLAAFLVGLLLYVGVLGGIYFQNRAFRGLLRHRKGRMLALANIELLGFLAIYHFVLASHRYFLELPFILDSQGLIAMFSLILYLTGVAVFHYSAYPVEPMSSKLEYPSPCNYALTQLRMLFPFAIPFLVFTFLLDLLKLYPDKNIQDVLVNNQDNMTGMVILFIVSLVFMGLMMVLLPPLIQKIWKCEPLEKGELRDRLESLCQRANFKHAGLKTWTVMNQTLTAAIIGVFAPFRYVMFTRRLTREVSPEATEAILAHEIGHSYRRHLLIYPFIVLGMMVVAGLFSGLFSDAITEYLALQNLYSPSVLWDILYPFAVFVPYALIIVVYFRLVFGFYSRLFERQADLHVFHLNIPSEHMVEALDCVAVASGNVHDVPSWHHYSIQERIDFLEAAKENPSIIEQHHLRVRNNLYRYFIFLLLGVLLLFSSLMPETPPFSIIHSSFQELSEDITYGVTKSVRRTLAEKYVAEYALKGDKETLLMTLQKSFLLPGAAFVPGVAEYYAAKELLDKGELSASATLMAQVWESFDLSHAPPEVITEFNQQTNQILDKIERSERYSDESIRLKNALQKGEAS